MVSYKIPFLVVLWWTCSIWANVYSKKVFLHSADFATQLTFAQTSTAVFILGFVLDTKLFDAKYFSQLFERTSTSGLVILSILHAFGNLLSNASLESVDDSFATLLKAAEPIFTIYFSRLMGKHEPSSLYLATIPVMFGVAISSLAEVKFSALGFTAAVASVSCFTFRNVYMKKLEGGDNLGIFFLVSCGSAAILAIIQAFRSTFHDPSSGNLAFSDSFFNIVCASALHSSYNIFSFLVLGQVVPLTHAVISITSQAAVILVAIILFSAPMTAVNISSIVIIVAGSSLFSFFSFRNTTRGKSPRTDDEEEAKPTTLPPPSYLKILMIVGLFVFVIISARPTNPTDEQANAPVIWGDRDGVLAIQEVPEKKEIKEEHTICTPKENDWNELLKWDSPKWVSVRLNLPGNPPIIGFFGCTAMGGWHFGMLGASYMVDREMRELFGEDAILIPIGPQIPHAQRGDDNLRIVDRVVYNWEGTFHDTLHGKQLMSYVRRMADYQIPTYHINIAWYPSNKTEAEMAEILKNMDTLEHLASRDVHGYKSMQAVGLTEARQAADLTFLLPHVFSCEVEDYFAKKHKFWANTSKFKVIVTTTSSLDNDIRNAIDDAIQLITAEKEGQVEIISVLDDVKSGIRTLQRLYESSIYEAMWFLKHADLVITGRFHCGTYSRIAGVPAVLLPGNTAKVHQLAQMINSPAYPMSPRPTGNVSWGLDIWNKGKQAIAYAKRNPLDKDGILEKLHTMSRNNFPAKEDDSVFNTREITAEELERQVNYQRTVQFANLRIAENNAPPRFGMSYNTETRKYDLHPIL